jgi:hypothetical protein
LPTDHEIVQGDVELIAMDDTQTKTDPIATVPAYSGCQGTTMAGLPITTGTNLPMASRLYPVPSKSAYTAADESHDNDYTTSAPEKAKRTADFGETSKARDIRTKNVVVPAGPGR